MNFFSALIGLRLVCILILLTVAVGCTSGSNCGVAGRGTGSNCPVSSGNASRSGPQPLPGDFKICSKLSFANVEFPSAFTFEDTQAVEAAMNISGSYEGETGWVNLTNNFDGQGLSLGLLNQCLGQGSLQPLLIQMLNEHPTEMSQVFDAPKLQSLKNMLTAWQSAQSDVVTSLDEKLKSQFDLSAPLDSVPSAVLAFAQPSFVASVATSASSTTAETTSVQWAINNLYTDGGGLNFNSAWAAQLTAMAQLPDYVSIQVEAATKLHALALTYLGQLGLYELRAYLLMFDFNVQDGGIYTEDWTDFNTYVSQNPGASDTDRLREILALRLRHVNSAYASDVESRKETIINGTGTVHGESRNLPAQYCYPQAASYR